MYQTHTNTTQKPYKKVYTEPAIVTSKTRIVYSKLRNVLRYAHTYECDIKCDSFRKFVRSVNWRGFVTC